MIRLYDATNSSYKLVNELSAKDVSWSILDVAFSPDGEYFAYSTWSMCSKYSSLVSQIAIVKSTFVFF
jgi:hypothetical protein